MPNWPAGWSALTGKRRPRMDERWVLVYSGRRGAAVDGRVLMARGDAEREALRMRAARLEVTGIKNLTTSEFVACEQLQVHTR